MRNLNRFFEDDKMKALLASYSCDESEIRSLQEILNYEWDFFDQVKGMNGRSYCQDDSKMFLTMRLAQHLLFSNETRFSILNDYISMKNRDVNPIVGKYARMMKYTDEEIYKTFLDKLPDISPIKRQSIIDIIRFFERDLKRINLEMPMTAKNLRPQETTDKHVSSLSYLYAELTFFSYKTLRLMKTDIENIYANACLEKILQNTVIIDKYLN